MNAPFFIIGLPRSRTAWLANLMTYGPAFCLHDGLKDCQAPEELKHKLAALGAVWPGDADPALPLFMPQIVATFPGARYVFIHRDAGESKASYAKVAAKFQSPEEIDTGFARLQEAFVQAREALANQHVLDVPFARLEHANTCLEIWNHCVPGEPFNLDRWQMLDSMRVSVIPEKAVLEVDTKIINLLSTHQRAPVAPFTVRNTEPTLLQQEYLKLLGELCGDNQDAAHWLYQLLHVTLTWDHIRDNDPIDKTVANAAFEALLLDWPGNKFWTENARLLGPVMANAICAWFHSESYDPFKAYDVYTEIPCAVALILGGRTRMAAFSGRVRQLAARIHQENNQKDEALK